MSTEQELAYWRKKAAFEEWFTKTKAYISDPTHIIAQVVKDIAWEAWQAALQSQHDEETKRLRDALKLARDRARGFMNDSGADTDSLPEIDAALAQEQS